MPKIPTFEAKGNITTEAPTVRTGIQLSPYATPGAALIKPVTQIAEYYEREKLIADKAEADKQYLQLSIELDEIEANAGKLFNPTEAQNTFNTQARFLIKQKIDQTKNKRIKQMLSDTFDQDIIIRTNNVKKLARAELDKQEEYNYNTKYEINLSKYKLATSQQDKDFYKNQIFASQESRSLYFKDSELTKQQSLDKINLDLFDIDFNTLMDNKQFGSALDSVKDLNNTKFLTADQRIKYIEKIQKESAEYNETNLYVNEILKGSNPLIGASFKNTSEKKVLETTDNVLFAQAEKNNLNEEQTFAYVDQIYSETGILSPTYKDLFEFAYNTGSTTTFDSDADIPQQLKLAVKSAEIADRTGRLNVYTNPEQERFFRNIIVLKTIKGLDDFQAIKQAKDFEINYDQEIIRGANKQRNKMLDNIENSKKFKNSKATNIGEVRSYASQLYNIYISFGIDDRKAQEKVIKDLESSIIEIDDHAYLKRDIEVFKSVGNLDQIKSVKELIVKDRLTDEDPDDYYLRHIGGGLFEIRREVDISPVYGDDDQPLIFYPQDLAKIIQKTQEEQKLKTKEEVIQSQERKIEAKEEFETSGFNITGS